MGKIRILKKIEDEFILKNYGILKLKEICKALNISINTLHKNLIRLGFSKRKIPIIPREYERNCPNCNKIITYKHYRGCYEANKKNYICKSCELTGINNPFYGKHHSDSTIKYLHEIHKGISYSPKSQFKKGFIGSDKNFYNHWRNKYDKETYNEKVKKHKEKLSKASLGQNNPMYGKPAPKGSGNGWSGWYKCWFFRSINELSYMVQVIERFNLKWENGESQKYKISYIDWVGKQRNYFPDFIIAGKYIVECKPKRLWNTPGISAKRIGALKYCEDKDMIYKLVECRKLLFNEICSLRQTGLIKFTDRYEEKFINYINKN